MNYEYALKFGPGKYGEFSAALTVDLTMACVDLNKRHVRDLAPVSRENTWCTSQCTHITNVELVHRQPLADIV